MTTDKQLTSPILSRVNTINIKKTKDGYRIPCPIHDGEDSNFLLREDESGYCYSSCSKWFSKKDIYEHLGEDYLPEILTLDKFKEAFNFTDDDIKKFGLKENKNNGIVVPYHDINNEYQGTKYRKHLDNVSDKFFTTKDFNPVLYGSQFLGDIRKSKYVLLVEGETDTISAWRREIPALGISGASNWKDIFIELYGLDKLSEVYVWYEKDEASKKLIEKIGADLPNAIVVQHEKHKDISEMNKLIENTEEFQDLLIAAQKKNETAGDFNFNARNERFLEISQNADYGDLINLAIKKEKDFNEKLIKDIADSGFAGNVAPVLAAILSINSKKLSKSFHIQFLAPSGAGKSFSVDTAIKFFPEDHIHIIEASTPAAWIYDETDISNKALYVKELDSVPQGDSTIASAVRNGMSEGVLRYSTTVEDKIKGRKILHNDRKCKSIITTGTKTPEIQTSTRLLLMDVDYSTDQIKLSMDMKSRFHAGLFQTISPEVWKLYFEALEIKFPKDIEVSIPFSPKIAAAITNNADYLDERWNRDFDSLIAAIQSSAILHYLNRETDDKGRLIATLDDYEFVRNALWRSFQVSQKQGITDTQQEILEAIQKLEKDGILVTQKKLSEFMNKKPSYISSQLKKPVLKRWIEVSKGDKTSNNLHVEVLPDSIIIPTRKEVEKAKFEAAPNDSNGTRREVL